MVFPITLNAIYSNIHLHMNIYLTTDLLFHFVNKPLKTKYIYYIYSLLFRF